MVFVRSSNDYILQGGNDLPNLETENFSTMNLEYDIVSQRHGTLGITWPKTKVLTIY
jgi:hypothetical protein